MPGERGYGGLPARRVPARAAAAAVAAGAEGGGGGHSDEEYDEGEAMDEDWDGR